MTDFWDTLNSIFLGQEIEFWPNVLLETKDICLLMAFLIYIKKYIPHVEKAFVI